MARATGNLAPFASPSGAPPTGSSTPPASPSDTRAKAHATDSRTAVVGNLRGSRTIHDAPHRPGARTVALAPLTPDARKSLKAAVEQKKWKTFSELVRKYEFHGEDLRARDVLLVAPYVKAIQEEHYDRWQYRSGCFAEVHGFPAPETLDGETVGFEEILVSNGFPKDWVAESHELAYHNGFLNVTQKLNTHAKTTTGYMAELAGVGWREANRATLSSAISSAPDYYAQLLIQAPALPGDTTAPARRAEALQRLTEEAGSLEKVIRRYDLDKMEQVWKAYTALTGVTKAKVGQELPPIDLTELILPLMERRKPTAENWLRAQLLACDGHSCSICGISEEKTGWLSPTTAVLAAPGQAKARKTQNPADYILACRSCKTQRRRASNHS